MAYLRMGSEDVSLGGFGCGPGCSCTPCRRQNSTLAEWYVPEEEDEEPPRPAPPPAAAKRPPSEPARTGAWDHTGLGFDASGPAHRAVFVPGIMGSRLIDAHDNRVVWGDASMLNWLPHVQQWIARMRLGNGIDNPGSIAPRGLFRIHSPVHRQDFDPYSAIMARLQNALGTGNVRACPYDWRLSNEFSALRLKKLVESAWPDAANHPSQRITVIAHSMGGQVARWYIEKLGGYRYVKRLITVGTPHHGAPKAIQVVMDTGSAATLAGLASFVAPVSGVAGLAGLAGPLLRALQRMISGFASIYQLMPDFDCVYPSPVARVMEPIAVTYRKLATSPALNPILGGPGLGRSLIRGPRAAELRRLNGQLRRSEAGLTQFLPAHRVQYIAVAGLIRDTVVAVRSTTPITVVAMVSRCGDGTVPVNSASLTASGAVRTLYTRTNREHGVLFWDPAVQQLCINAATGIADPAAGIHPPFLPAHAACAPARPSIPFVGAIPGFGPAAEVVRRAGEAVLRMSP